MKKNKQMELIFLIQIIICFAMIVFGVVFLFNHEVKMVLHLLFLLYSLIMTYNYFFVMKKKLFGITFLIIDIITSVLIIVTIL